MKHTLCYFFSLISALAGICPILKPGTVPAAIIASDNFDGYAAASPLTGGNGGSGFSAGWLAPGTGLSATVTTPGLAAGGVSGGSNSVEVAGITNTIAAARALSTTLPDTFFVSTLIRLESGTWDGSNTFSFYLSNSATNVGAGTMTFGIRNAGGTDLSNPAAPGGGAFMVRQTTTSPQAGGVIPGTTVATLTDYYLVARYGKSGAGAVSDWDKLDLWLNPSLSDLGTPQASLTLAADAGLTTFSHVLVRAAVLQGPGATEDKVRFDELRIADQWGDLVPVPEPGAGLLSGVFLLGLLARRKR